MSFPSSARGRGVFDLQAEVFLNPSARASPNPEAETAKMILRYTVTIEDKLAFQQHHFLNSPTSRKAMLESRLLVTALLGLFAIYTGVLLRDSFGGYCFSILAAILFITLPASQRRGAMQHMRNVYAEGGTAPPEPVDMELLDDTLVVEEPRRETRMHLSLIERVVTEGDHSFIFLSAVNALVVPHRSVSFGDPKAFVETLNARIVGASGAVGKSLAQP